MTSSNRRFLRYDDFLLPFKGSLIYLNLNFGLGSKNDRIRPLPYNNNNNVDKTRCQRQDSLH